MDGRLDSLFDAHHQRLYRLPLRADSSHLTEEPMTRLRDILRDADPLRHESESPMDVCRAVRVTVVAAEAAAMLSGDYTRAQAERIARGIRLP